MEHAPRARATNPGPRLGATLPNIAYQIVRYVRGLPKKLDILIRTRESWIKSPHPNHSQRDCLRASYKRPLSEAQMRTKQCLLPRTPDSSPFPLMS